MQHGVSRYNINNAEGNFGNSTSQLPRQSSKMLFDLNDCDAFRNIYIVFKALTWSRIQK